MDGTLRAEAETRLTEALRDTGAVDPRPACREMIRELRLQSPAAYDEATEAYERSVVERIGQAGADPLASWLEYGCELAQRLYPGRGAVIDPTGRAAPLDLPLSWRDLILHLPDDRRVRCLVVGRPPELTRAQSATVDLLAVRAVKLAGA